MVIDAKRLSARVLVVICLASLAGLAAWVATRGKTSIYERTVSFVVVPDPKFGATQVASNVDQTIAGGIGSKRMLDQLLVAAGYNPASEKQYTLAAFVRPGADIIDARLRGPDSRVLSAMGKAYIRMSEQWAARFYDAYELAYPQTTATPGVVSPHPKRTIGLGIVLGGLLGLLVLYAESQVASRRSNSRRDLLQVSESELHDHESEADPTSSQRDEQPVQELGRRSAQAQRGSTGARKRRRRAGRQGH